MMRGQRTTTPPDAPVERLISGASPVVCAAITGAAELDGVEAAELGGGAAVFGSAAGAPPQLQRARTASLNGMVLMSSSYYFGPRKAVKARRRREPCSPRFTGVLAPRAPTRIADLFARRIDYEYDIINQRH
jgi:hypothetical protein